MNHLHLLIPDLFPPQDIAAEVCAGLRLLALEKILARATASASAIDTLEDCLCAAFAAEGVAPVRAAADGIASGEDYWLCADPVNLQLHRTQMVLQPDVRPSREEAAALCVTLNQYFSGMGLRFHAPHPQRWYVSAKETPQVSLFPMSRVAWRDAKPFQPQGADALRWQGVATEAQMLLHAHPLNQAREERGELTINSLWLWGGGRAQTLKKPFDTVGGDSGLAAAFAQAAGMSPAGSLAEMLDGRSASGLWVVEALSAAHQHGDYFAWRERVQQIERECAQPLLRALGAGRLQRLTLEVLREKGSRRFELTRGDTWKLWRASRPLARHAV